MGKYEGQKFLVLSQGPSIDCYDNDYLHNFDGITIGVNYIRLRFVPHYIVVPDIIGMTVMDARNPDLYEYKPKCMRPMGDGTWKTGEPHIRNDYVITPVTSFGRAMGLAYSMGASEIHVLGADYCPSPKGRHYFRERQRRLGGLKHEGHGLDVLSYTDGEFDSLIKRMNDVIGHIENGGCKVIDKSPFGKLGIAKDLSGIANADI